jgi:hypothetical protein
LSSLEGTTNDSVPIRAGTLPRLRDGGIGTKQKQQSNSK